MVGVEAGRKFSYAATRRDGVEREHTREDFHTDAGLAGWLGWRFCQERVVVCGARVVCGTALGAFLGACIDDRWDVGACDRVRFCEILCFCCNWGFGRVVRSEE